MKTLERIERARSSLIDEKREVIVRIAPSPTGPLHLGTARTALFNYLFARRFGGKYIVRIEDTDQKRSTKEFEQDILEGLAWLSLSPDLMYRQSERMSVYAGYVEKLIKSGAAYVSKEQSRDDPNLEVEVVRLKNKNTLVAFDDLVHGRISFDTTELGDFVIAKAGGNPLYHLAVVIDDHEMGITHVIRGEDHISNTPRQILIQEALGVARPAYAHIPLILAPDRSKLSKRYGAVSLLEYRLKGYRPEALINYLALLGWNPGGEREIFSRDDLAHLFDIHKINKSGAIFSEEKLNWFNREYLRAMPMNEMLVAALPFLPHALRQSPEYTNERFARLMPILLERITTFADIATLAENGELGYFFMRPVLTPESLRWKNDSDSTPAKRHLAFLLEALHTIQDSAFTAKEIKDAVWEYATNEGRGSVLWPMRYALSGRAQSPDPFILAEVLGKNETLARLTAASATIE